MNISNLKRLITTANLRLYLFVLIVLFVVMMGVMSFGSTLTADDYQFYKSINENSILTSLTTTDGKLTGRYGNALVLIFSIELLGVRAVKILPILSLLIIIAGVSYTSYGIFGYLRRILSDRRILLTLTSVFAVLAALITAPSIFDTYVWFSASTVYITSVAVLSIASSIMIASMKRSKTPLWSFLAVFVLLLFAAGFFEFIPIFLGLLGTVGIVLTMMIKKRSTRRRTNFLSYSIITVLAAVIGALLLRFSPWTIARINSGAHRTVIEVGRTMFDHLHIIPEFILSWKLLFAVCIGLLIYIAYGKLVTKKQYVITLFIAIVCIFFPLLTIAWLVGQSGIVEPNGYASNRVLAVGTTGILIGLSLITFLALSAIFSRSYRTKPFIASAGVLLTIALCFSMSPLLHVTQAVYTKKSMFEYREAVIAYDLATNKKEIRFMPAPILLADSQINDIEYGPDSAINHIWVNTLKPYYNIPPDSVLIMPEDVSPGYCTTFSHAEHYRSRSCADIAPQNPQQKFLIYSQ